MNAPIFRMSAIVLSNAAPFYLSRFIILPEIRSVKQISAVFVKNMNFFAYIVEKYSFFNVYSV